MRPFGLFTTMTSEERQRVITGLFGSQGERAAFWLRYAVLLTLSAVIATAGLSSGSGAVVIGAMLIAPLMTPMVGFVAASCTRLRKRAFFAGVVLAASTAWVVVVAWGLTTALPGVPFSDEVLARTSPDVRDLIVALAAGVAGSWATLRPDVSPTLPGVAVAVALVPPLAATGIVIHAGDWALAEGTVLLYMTNLLAIIGSSFVVFIVGGFPPRKLLRTSFHVPIATITMLVLAIVAISWPLWQRAEAIAEHSRTERVVTGLVNAWIEPYRPLDVTSIAIDANAVTVDVTGPTAPPGGNTLADDIVEALGFSIDVQVRWSQRLDGADMIDAPDALDMVRAGVDAWAAAAGHPIFVDRIVLNHPELLVSVSSINPPPAGGTMLPYLPEGTTWEVLVAWTQLVDVVEQDAARIAFEDEVASIVRDWAADVGLDVDDVRVGDPGAASPVVMVVVSGSNEPRDARALDLSLRRLFDASGASVPTLRVSYTPRILIPNTAPTTTIGAGPRPALDIGPPR